MEALDTNDQRMRVDIMVLMESIKRKCNFVGHGKLCN